MNPADSLCPHEKTTSLVMAKSLCNLLLECVFFLLWARYVLATSYPNKGNIFVYGNRKALAQFETTWGELVGTPSTQSADPDTEVRCQRLDGLLNQG